MRQRRPDVAHTSAAHPGGWGSERSNSPTRDDALIHTPFEKDSQDSVEEKEKKALHSCCCVINRATYQRQNKYSTVHKG